MPPSEPERSTQWYVLDDPPLWPLAARSFEIELVDARETGHLWSYSGSYVQGAWMRPDNGIIGKNPSV